MYEPYCKYPTVPANFYYIEIVIEFRWNSTQKNNPTHLQLFMQVCRMFLIFCREVKYLPVT